GSGSGKDRDERWPDYLARRLADEGGPRVAVINTGINGNRMLRDDTGPNLLSRFEHDVLARPGVTHALVLIGVNDMGHLLRAGADTPEAR
ncbi:GDSL-type esterase/lipase family protein, partial [Lactobacillus acidophilus]|uniref:GDSL-type esterase/lipase family protein n=1 Tax=Lactobacillus acidophilus TaxID=1579 RepID=UPI0030F23902